MSHPSGEDGPSPEARVHLVGSQHHEIVDVPRLGRRMVRIGEEAETCGRGDAQPLVPKSVD